MYQSNPVTPIFPVLGVATLPYTGGNELLLTASIVTIVFGLAVIVTTAVRQALKKKAVKA